MHLLSAKTKSSDLVEDLVGGLRPREGLALRVVCLDVCEDGFAQLRHAGMRSPSQGLFGEHSEEPLHEIEPRRVGGCEMKVDAGMAQQPPLHGWCAVGRQIVEDHVDVERGLDGRFDVAQKADEILCAMSVALRRRRWRIRSYGSRLSASRLSSV